MTEELDYLHILQALDEIPFGVGKRLLIDFLQGDTSNTSIKKNNLQLSNSFGSLSYDESELDELIGRLLLHKLVEQVSVKANAFWKVFQLTAKGKKELTNPQLHKPNLDCTLAKQKTRITEQEKKLFIALEPFLGKYTDSQKKAIISQQPEILCIAGAGSGKTSVLTKRIDFLTKYRSVKPEKILAITFTRKARQEMMSRIEQTGVVVETFNSYCEKVLQKHNDLIYDKPVRVLSYRDKILLVKKALRSINLNLRSAITIYFTAKQRMGKEDKKLAHVFLNDVFTLRDYFKSKHLPISKESFEADASQVRNVEMILKVCAFIDKEMFQQGLRDFTDQLLDTVMLFQKNPQLIPTYEHVLVDEYQDVNGAQISFIDLLQPQNIFCVGDPRQSIYGWRGSDIKHILHFTKRYPSCEVITLTKNFRSTPHIVSVTNSAIERMGLPHLEAARDGTKQMELKKCLNASKEYESVIERIYDSNLPRNEIMILARTNKQLTEMSTALTARKIKHVLRSDEQRKSVIAGSDEITLATIHAIKGLEAEMVCIIGCTSNHFPCKGSEHPIIDLIKVDSYDKEEEERRLFYVAMSRAKNELYLSYTGKNPTYFLTEKMKRQFGDSQKCVIGFQSVVNKQVCVQKPIVGDVVDRLKEWRTNCAKKSRIAPYRIIHDKTIEEIAMRKPKSYSELSSINGLGDVKIAKYGSELLSLVN